MAQQDEWPPVPRTVAKTNRLMKRSPWIAQERAVSHLSVKWRQIRNRMADLIQSESICQIDLIRIRIMWIAMAASKKS